ncbi:eukaryotic porin/Tom40 [Morchella snyderi]|nr:eukaryotic porin/Tom40 [Morchella snyderi]
MSLIMDKTMLPSFVTENPITHAISTLSENFHNRRATLGLTNPGTIENISREALKDVFLNNFLFSGMRADLSKSFSMDPIFQTSHSFAMGAQGIPPYTFAALFGNSKTFLQANIDNEGQLSGRANYRWTPALVSKINVQLAPPAMSSQSVFTMDTEYTGADFSAGIKSFNPSLLEGTLTGIFIGSYLQSVTPNLSLGLESVWQRQAASVGPETALSYVARYATKDWVASAQLQAQGALQATYWRRIAERVEAGVDCQLTVAGGMARSGGGMMGGGMRKEGITTVGAKYEFRMSTFRAQVDTSGRLCCMLEKRIAPTVSLTFVGDVDHFKVCLLRSLWFPNYSRHHTHHYLGGL